MTEENFDELKEMREEDALYRCFFSDGQLPRSERRVVVRSTEDIWHV